MYEERFSDWRSWKNRGSLLGLGYPGVYAVAISPSDLSGAPFSWRTEIIYIGMTNAAAGLKGRLQQFDSTIAGKTGHGGADRVRYKHRNYKALCKKLYVAVAPFECDVTSSDARDLLVMGRVASFEYKCFAHFVAVRGQLPEFNQKQASKKYSLTVGDTAPPTSNRRGRI